MKIILSKTDDPYYNIATEEYLLKNCSEDIFFLYINSKSIVVGKHQNTLSEINYNYVIQNNIPVVRRLSGGGTVFHDKGNINFCFITTGAKRELINFKKHTQPMVDFLKSININAHLGGRNDILIEGSKISGNACHVFKSRVMHHGTLLFESELSALTNSLKNDPLKFKDKAVKSVRSKVTNIKSHLKDELTVDEFVKGLAKFISENYSAEYKTLNNEEGDIINTLSNDKYNTWDWNFAYGPKFELKKRIKGNNGKRFEISMKVNKGIITDAKLKGNSKDQKMIEAIETTLQNTKHHPELLYKALNNLNDESKDLSSEQIIEAIF
ncbi:lipoate--protein ligase [Saccharicrinis aurantiacus]|uniref:lipoate--protein ligase n=1 Tax=Saccharicrinis aurantiacus TaxID=1849719 RepID=UPI00094FC8BC|nr:lipoate--protein ligase [Saccharicrinis aurantiacus]